MSADDLISICGTMRKRKRIPAHCPRASICMPPWTACAHAHAHLHYAHVCALTPSE